MPDHWRDELIRLAREKYGPKHVVMVGTFSRPTSESVLRSIGRVLGIDAATVEAAVRGVTAEREMELAKSLTTQTVERAYSTHPRMQELFDRAAEFQAIQTQTRTHTSRVVISEEPVTARVPLHVIEGSRQPVTQWPMGDVVSSGLPTCEIMACRALSVISLTCGLIEGNHGQKIEPFNLTFDDPTTYNLLARGETHGVFLLESLGIRNWLQRVQPSRFEELMVIDALYRPGPLASGMFDAYVAGKNQRDSSGTGHPEIDSTLAETYGVLVYHEQAMTLLQRLGDISLLDGWKCLSAASRKKEEVSEAVRTQFLDKARENGLSTWGACEVWEHITTFVNYGFSKSHAAAWAQVAYIMAYLKAHFPTSFMAALLIHDRPRTGGKQELIRGHLAECERLNIEVLEPDGQPAASDSVFDTGVVLRFKTSNKEGNHAGNDDSQQDK